MKKLQKSDKHEVATAAMNNGRIAESYADSSASLN